MRYLSLAAFASIALAQGTITVYHETATVAKGTSRQFTAYVPLSPNTVRWSVNGVDGGSAALGTVTQTGLYQAPASVPASNVVHVTATSTAYPAINGKSVVTISQPQPDLWSVTPRAASAGMDLKLTLNAANVTPEARVLVSGVTQPATYVNSRTMTLTYRFEKSGRYGIQIENPAPGRTVSNSVLVTIGAPNPVPNVTVTPKAATVRLGLTQQFTANTPVSWTASAGTISAGGLYTAPAMMPGSPMVTVRATSTSDTTKSATASITLEEGVALTLTPTAATVRLGESQAFTASVPVTWSATTGVISAAGVYTAPATMPGSPMVTLRATSVSDTTKSATAAITLTAPSPSSSALANAGRFLEQAAFGPTPQAISEVQMKGVDNWLSEQFNLPETGLVAGADERAAVLHRLMQAPDQLRQRVAWALGQIIVISWNKNPYGAEYVPYLNILSRNAFGNYRTLLKEITLSPQMGKYLDLANSNRPGLGGGANENFPRELLQLFSIGLVQLNPDGSPKPGPIPTYTQDDVRQFALALTGWTYPTAPGATPRANNWEEFSQSAMEPRPGNHDTGPKVLLNGVVLPAGQTVEQDLEGVIDCVFRHPNVGPFVATRLIRSLVTSNPSGAYIQRVAGVFDNNGSGVRGDLKAVVRAILTDAEARPEAPAPQHGRLKDPVFAYISFLRAMNGSLSASNSVSWIFSRMGQAITAPPSVFGYYSPLYRLPANPAWFGPEFQIYTPTESVLMGNELFWPINYPANGDPRIDLAPFLAATELEALVELVNQRLFYGRMSAGLRQALVKAAGPSYNQQQRVETVLYLAALSGEYAVHR